MSVSYARRTPPSLYTPQNPRHYQPKTPSPLRTSRNANIMPAPPPTPAAPTSSKPHSETKSSPLSVVTNADELENVPNSNPASTFTFSTPPSSSTTTTTTAQPQQQPHFAFASRARSQSPQVALARTNRDAKERRKTLLLERVRQSRDDARYDARSDQALRIEFVQERREWEERLRRRAPVDEEVDLEAMDEDGDVGEVEEMSPTEEREIEELLSYLDDGGDGDGAVEGERMLGRVSGYLSDSQPRKSIGSDTMSDDDDYDQLFQEVLAQGQHEDLGMGSQELGQWQAVDQDSSMDLS